MNQNEHKETMLKNKYGDKYHYIMSNYRSWFLKPSLDIPLLALWSDWKWFAQELLLIHPLYLSDLQLINWERGDKLIADSTYLGREASPSGIYISTPIFNYTGINRYELVYAPKGGLKNHFIPEYLGHVHHAITPRMNNQRLIGIKMSMTRTGHPSTRYGVEQFSTARKYYPLDKLVSFNLIKQWQFINWPFDNPLNDRGGA